METKRPYWKVAVSLLLSLIGTVLFVIIGAKLLLYFMPFVIGWFISYIANPLVKWLEKRLKIVRKLGSAIIIILVLGLIVLAAYFGISKLVTETIKFMESFPEYYHSVEQEVIHAGNRMQGVFYLLPDGAQDLIFTMADNLSAAMADWMSQISEPTVAAAGSFAKKVPAILIAVIVTVIAAYFFIAEREEVIVWSKKITPQPIQRRMELVIHNMKYAVGGYFKAQFKIMIVVAVILLLGLGVLKVRYTVLLALLIALLDFFPFFGTGTAMIPWAIFKALAGDYKMAIWLFVIYVITQGVRQIVQPKLVGDSMGLNPLITLALLYVGYKVGSVLGMIFAVPIGMIVINMFKAGAFDYILDDVKILMIGILKLRE